MPVARKLVVARNRQRLTVDRLLCTKTPEVGDSDVGFTFCLVAWFASGILISSPTADVVQRSNAAALYLTGQLQSCP
jgi:hypothetical protein